MRADAKSDGRPAEYRWRPMLNAAKFGHCGLANPTARVPCSNAAKIGERKIWTQSEFCTWQNSGMGQKPPKMCIYSEGLAAQEAAKHRATFGWPPLSDVAAVTKRRRETRWNLQGCPKLANRSQPLSGRSSPYCEVMWERRCCLTIFPIVDTCLSCEDTARQICATLPRWRFLATFGSCISSEPHAAHFRPAF